jgi:hypothetical protein
MHQVLGQNARISLGTALLAVPQTLSAVDTFQAPLVVCRKNTLGPGFTRAAAHIVGEAIAQSNLSMIDPAGSAATMEAFVHSPAAWEADEPLDGGACAVTSELDGVPWDGVADVVAPVEDADEHPVSNTSPMPPKAKRHVTLLTVV